MRDPYKVLNIAKAEARRDLTSGERNAEKSTAGTSVARAKSELHTSPGDKIAQRISERGSLAFAGIGSDERREIGKMVNTLFPAIPPETSRLVAIAGVDEGAAATHIAACAGEILAQQVDVPVCLIDAEVNINGTIHHPFSAKENDAALALETSPNYVAIRKHCVRVSENLWTLSIGLNRDVSIARRMRSRMEELEREFPYCLLVIPPIVTSADAVLLSTMASGIVLVLDSQSTRRDAAAAAKGMLTRAGVPILGAVLNNRKFPIPDWLYSRL
jgi:Mrp family chromosome partitioning ATPase